MYSHSKTNQARIIGQIQGCYKNTKTLLTPTINQIEFEKAVREDSTSFFFDEVIKGYATETLKKVEKETDEIKKSEILTDSKTELNSLERVDVVFDNMTKSMYVDVIDTTTNTYKDNAINRKFDRVGEVVVGRTEIEKAEETKAE